jgi:hypothetical protein
VIIVPGYIVFGGQPGYSPVATTWAAGFYPCPVCRSYKLNRPNRLNRCM